MDKMRSIKVKDSNWQLIVEDLRQRYPLSVTTIRAIMKQRLGFLPRSSLGPLGDEDVVYLDFYDHNKYTLFQMTYGEYIDRCELTKIPLSTR